MKTHKLLVKQIKKYLPESLQQHPDIEKLLSVVNDSYFAFDKDKGLADLAFQISEEDYTTINDQLKHELELKRKSIEKLRETVVSVTGEVENNHTDDLLMITGYLDQQVNKRRNAELVFTSLINNLQSAILLEDEHRHIVFTNQQFCDMFGIPLSPESLQGADCSNSAEQSKSLFKYPENFVSVINEILKKKELVTGAILELADGRFFERDFIPIVVDKKYKGHLWSYTNITKEKEAEHLLQLSEEKYRNIIANMHLGLLEVDNDDLIQTANQSFCEMSGYSLDELIGRRASDILIKDPSQNLFEEKNELRKRKKSDAYEIEINNKKGEEKWWLISGAPRYNDKADMVGSIGIHLDITAQKKLEQELIGAREMAESSANAKDEFLANMSHEIRTPMNAILGMANQLGKTQLNKDQRFYLETVYSAAENLLIILNDILDLSKIDAGKLSLEKIGFEPRIVLDRVMQVMLHRAEEKGLSFTNSICDSTLSNVLMGDPYRLNQILINLVSNAIKFTQKGFVEIGCEVISDLPKSQKVKITVKDTGIGMEDSFAKNIFNKFSQEDSSIIRKYGGTGLGMSICKELVDLMGGEINVISNKGEGTVVSVLINFEKDTNSDLPLKEMVEIDLKSFTGKKILVTDDNEMNQLVATTILKNYNAEVTKAYNGEDAIEKLSKSTFDLVLMDVQMPVMDGIEATKIIRKTISKDLPIIALTALAIKGDNQKCIDAGMNDYLSKPFGENQLINIVSKWLSKVEITAESTSLQKEKEHVYLYDLSKLRDIARGDEAFVEKMVLLFIQESTTALEEIQVAYKEGNWLSVRRIAHRIKPSIDNLGIYSLVNEIREIEKDAETNQGSDRMDWLMEHFEKVIKAVNNQMISLHG
ncbi:MAG: response regulator [Ferruginibacter sp.]